MRRLLLFSLLTISLLSARAQQSSLKVVWPSEGYYTTDQKYLLPLDTVVHFSAFPDGATTWRWDLQGATPDMVEAQEAAVVYTESGVYDVCLSAVVSGVDNELSLKDAVQAGDANFVWNVSNEEVSSLETISLAWYGYYGGTNWLNLEKFAEFFHSPMHEAYIDSVAVRFGSTDVATTGAELIMSVHAVDEGGMPGEQLGITSLLASEINKTVGGNTFFRFPEAVKVDGPFFVVIGGFPNANGDGIAMECVRREAGATCTAYHLVADEDAHYQPTGTYTWYKNVDDPTTFAICPWLRYATSTGMKDQWLAEKTSAAFDGHMLYLPAYTSRLEIYDAGGTKVFSMDNPPDVVSLESLPHGFYLVRADGMTTKIRR